MDCSTHQALLSFTISRSLLRFVSIESVALTIISSALYPEGNAVASACTLQPGKPKSGAFLPPDPRKRDSSAVSSLLFILFKLQPFIYTILFACNVSFFYLTEVLPADGEIFFFLSQSQTQGMPDYPRFLESVDEYHFVERLLPPTSIPKPPKHEHYPTPCGWQPPRGELGDGDSLKAAGKHPSP